MSKPIANLCFLTGLVCIVVGAFRINFAMGCLVLGAVLVAMSIVHYPTDGGAYGA